AGGPFALDDLLLEITGELRAAMFQLGGEVAHLKVIGLADATFAVANLVSTASDVELSLASRASVSEVDLIVNARVAIDPLELQSAVIRIVESACQRRSAQVEFRQTQSLRPGRPVPTHRYAVPASVEA